MLPPPGAALRGRLNREAYDHVMANPPFYVHGRARLSKDGRNARSRAMQEGGLEVWLRFLAAAAKPGGTATVIHTAEALPQLLAAFEGRFGGLRLIPLHPKAGAPAIRVILCGIKGSRAPFAIAPGIVLHEEDGTPTAGRQRRSSGMGRDFSDTGERTSRTSRRESLVNARTRTHLKTIRRLPSQLQYGLFMQIDSERSKDFGFRTLWDRVNPFHSKGTLIPVLASSGTIGAATPLRQGLTISACAGAIERAFSIKNAPAVAIQINSPGGSPVQSRLIYERIRALATEKSRKVFAFAEDVAASGGYMLACAADEIYADALLSCGLDRRRIGGLRFYRSYQQDRSRAPRLYRRREQIPARPVQAGKSR